MSAETSIDATATSDDGNRLWTVQEAARFLAVSESWVYTATRTNVLTRDSARACRTVQPSGTASLCTRRAQCESCAASAVSVTAVVGARHE